MGARRHYRLRMRWSVIAAASGPRAIEVSPAAGVATLALALIAAAGIALLLRSGRLTKIDPSPATMELRPEAPAIVDLLAGGFTVEDDAVPATVVHLASRGWFSIEEYGNETFIRTKRVRPSNDVLEAYEKQVLDYIEAHAIDGVVPTRVLTTGRKQISKRWFRHFETEVIRHAQRLGLCVRRWGAAQLALAWVLAAVAALPLFFVFDAAGSAADAADWASTGNVVAGVAAVIALAVVVAAIRISRLGAQRDTPAGVTAAAHWFGVRDFYRATGQFADKSAASVAIWDDHLAYATALGLAHEVQRQIPFETEHDRHAWSRATGQWRRVKVRYRTLRPGWGMHPALVVLQSVFTIAVLGAVVWVAWNIAEGSWTRHYEDVVTITSEQERWLNLGAMVMVVVPALVIVHALARFLCGCADLFRRRTVEGEVVRARAFGGSDDSPPRYHLAIDTATPSSAASPLPALATGRAADSILAFKVRSSIYHQTEQGARVRIRVSPLLGYVASIETVAAAPEHVRALSATASKPGESLGAITGSMGGVAAASLSAGVGGLLSKLMARQVARLTPDQLDAVGPDGKTVREHLEESQAQIDAVFGGSGSAPLPPPVPPPDGSVNIG